jgi:HK97 family phage major capsid protein
MYNDPSDPSARLRPQDPGAMPNLYEAGRVGEPSRVWEDASLGEAFLRSDAWGGWKVLFGASPPRHAVSGPSAEVKLRLSDLGTLRVRALMSESGASGSAITPTLAPAFIAPGAGRPLRIADLCSHIAVSTGDVSFAREKSRVAAASFVPEATALTGTSGTKPEGGLEYEQVDAPIRSIAAWLPVTTRVLADQGQLRGLIDAYLAESLGEALEDEILSGSGGDGFTGILNDPGTGDSGPPGGGESMFDAIRKAVTKIQVDGRTDPTAVVLHPADDEALDLLKINAEANRFVASPFSGVQAPLFGLPRVVTDAMPQGTALVGDFRKAILFDRQSLAVSVGTVADDFIRNIVRILVELRAGFGIARPQAFVVVDLA